MMGRLDELESSLVWDCLKGLKVSSQKRASRYYQRKSFQSLKLEFTDAKIFGDQFA